MDDNMDKSLNASDGSQIYSLYIKSQSEQDTFDHVAVLKNSPLSVAVYYPRHQKNLIGLYKNILEKADDDYPFKDFIVSLIGNVNDMLEIISSGKASKRISKVPYELRQIRDDWGWIKFSYGIEEGGYFSKYYGITTSGISYQFVEPMIARNFANYMGKMMLPVLDDERASTMLDAYVKIHDFLVRLDGTDKFNVSRLSIETANA